MLKRRFDKLLSEGQGRQLIWLTIVTSFVFILYLSIAIFKYGMAWQEVLGLFMDPGTFCGPGKHDLFRVLIVLSGVMLFSALLISVFSNVFDNISESYQRGELRYQLKNHILIIGGSNMLKELLFAIKNNQQFDKKDILIVTTSNVVDLRQEIEIAIADNKFCNRILYYHSNRTSYTKLVETCPDKASMIYIIGENDEPSHDAISLSCLRHLEKICANSTPPKKCYMLVEMHSTLDLFQHLGADSCSGLCVEIINRNDYLAEIFLADTDFLPVMKVDYKKRLHIIINGNTSMGRAFASVAAQICHFPNFNNEKRTLISFIDKGMSEKMNNYVANHQNLFDLCHYKYISDDYQEEHHPQEQFGDFMDIEYEFIDGNLSSPFIRKMIAQCVNNEGEETVIVICHNDDMTNISTALHLPQAIYDKDVHVAVWQKEYPQIITEASSTKKYSHLYFFGDGMKHDDALFIYRSAKGKRVNRLYDLEYGDPPADNEEEAWMKLSHAHKTSSIASANSILTKLRSIGCEPSKTGIKLSDSQLDSLSEMEHRRWMVTMLLMGYSAAPATERKDRSRFKQLKNERFIHLDIAPYEELPHEQEKDMLIVSNIPYILYGEVQ